MIYLFSGPGLRILESLSFTTTLFAFDYDGTLSRIVPSPESARMTARISKLIELLATQVPVAVISGRGVEDLKGRLPFSPTYLVGNHGLEGTLSRSDSLESLEKLCKGWKEKLTHSFSGNQFGVTIEDKIFSLALHYRNSRHKKNARLKILEVVSGLIPAPRIVMGKCVVNLVAPGGPHKGVALLELILHSGVKSAFYIGDDDTDEDVFSLNDPRIVTVRVGLKKTSRAQFFLKKQAEMERLLKQLVDYTKPRSGQVIYGTEYAEVKR